MTIPHAAETRADIDSRKCVPSASLLIVNDYLPVRSCPENGSVNLTSIRFVLTLAHRKAMLLAGADWSTARASGSPDERSGAQSMLHDPLDFTGHQSDSMTHRVAAPAGGCDAPGG